MSELQKHMQEPGRLNIAEAIDLLNIVNFAPQHNGNGWRDIATTSALWKKGHLNLAGSRVRTSHGQPWGGGRRRRCWRSS
jgi:hypothetical protein